MFISLGSSIKKKGVKKLLVLWCIDDSMKRSYKMSPWSCIQLQQEQDQGISDGDGLTLKRLIVWTYDPLLRLKTLAALVDACKGGCHCSLYILLSTVVGFVVQQHQPFIKAQIVKLCVCVCVCTFEHMCTFCHCDEFPWDSCTDFLILLNHITESWKNIIQLLFF